MAQSQSAHVAGPVGLYENVRAEGESAQLGRARVRLQVERYPALVHAVGSPEQGAVGSPLPAHERPDVACRTSAHRLDLYHVRAQISQQLAAPVEPAFGEVENGVWRKRLVGVGG